MTTTADLLAALCAHLAAFELTTIASVHVGASLSAPQVTVQLASHGPSAIAQELLTRANTLTEVTAETWRAPRGDSVHMSVTGLLPSGAAVLVYGDQWATHRGLDADWAFITTIPLPMLRHAVSIEEVRT